MMDRADPKGAIQIAEQQRADALVSGDFERLSDILAPELTYSHSTGQIDSKASYLASLRAGKVVYTNILSVIERAEWIDDQTVAANGTVAIEALVNGSPVSINAQYATKWIIPEQDWLLISMISS